MPVFRSPHPDILNYEAFAILNGSISSFIGLWLRLELAQKFLASGFIGFWVSVSGFCKNSVLARCWANEFFFEKRLV